MSGRPVIPRSTERGGIETVLATARAENRELRATLGARHPAAAATPHDGSLSFEFCGPIVGPPSVGRDGERTLKAK
ncbi:MAG: hypothetical protein U0470_01755 [Anaerolineae bacterium]